MAWARAHLEVPFREKGRDGRGWDCWGLVVHAYAELYGVTLPSFAETYEGTGLRHRDTLATAIAVGREAWRRVSDPRSGDVAILVRAGRPMHVGLVVAADRRGLRVCHAERGVGTGIEAVPADDPQIEGVYRHAG